MFFILLIHSSVSSNLLLIPYNVFFISIVFFSSFSSSCFLLVNLFTVVVHSSFKFVEHLYDHHLNSLLAKLLYLHLFSFSSDVLSSSFVIYSPSPHFA